MLQTSKIPEQQIAPTTPSKKQARIQKNFTDKQYKQIIFYFCCLTMPRKSEAPGLKQIGSAGLCQHMPQPCTQAPVPSRSPLHSILLHVLDVFVGLLRIAEVCFATHFAKDEGVYFAVLCPAFATPWQPNVAASCVKTVTVWFLMKGPAVSINPLRF